MSHYYAAITQSARKTRATARGHKSTGLSGLAVSYDGVINYSIYHHDNSDWVLVERCTHPQNGGQRVRVLYDGPLSVFEAHSLEIAS